MKTGRYIGLYGMIGHYPEWLGRNLIVNNFQWSKGQSTSFPDFLTSYTLHDSEWIGFHHWPNSPSVAVFDWDGVFTQSAGWKAGRVRFADSPPDGEHILAGRGTRWHALLVQFERVWQIETLFYRQTAISYPDGKRVVKPLEHPLPETISRVESHLLSNNERTMILDGFTFDGQEADDLKEFILDDPLYHTVFHSIFGHRTEVRHGGETAFLCLDRQGKKVDLLDI